MPADFRGLRGSQPLRLGRVSSATTCAVVALWFIVAPANAQRPSDSEYVTIRLPHGLRVQMPRNWRVLTEDSRITLNAAKEALLHEINAEQIPSTLPFAANYYDGARVTAGMLNVRYYPDLTVTQDNVRAFDQGDYATLDSALHGQVVRAIEASGNRVLEWRGTAARNLSGHIYFISEYRRTSPTGKTFRVRLVRLLNGPKSFTVTVAYREDERVLRPITDYMISSVVLAK